MFLFLPIPSQKLKNVSSFSVFTLAYITVVVFQVRRNVPANS